MARWDKAIASGFSLTYAFVAIIVTFSFFGGLYLAMPSAFFLNQGTYNLIYQADPEIQEFFSAQDLAVFASTGRDNMTVEYSSITDAPDAPQWETAITDRFFEIKWTYEDISGSLPAPVVLHLDFRDTRHWVIWAGVWEGYTTDEWLEVYTLNGTNLGRYFTRSTMANNFAGLSNVTLQCKGQYLSANVFLSTNETTLLDAWDLETNLSYQLNYEIDFDAMKPDAWNLIAQLLTFQNPDFGLPDELGFIVNAFSIGLYVVIAIIVFTIVTRLIPTIQGGLED